MRYDSEVSMFRSKREEMDFYSSVRVWLGIPLLTGLVAGFFSGYIATIVAMLLYPDVRLTIVFLSTMGVISAAVWLWLTLIAFSKLGYIEPKPNRTTRIITTDNDGKQLKILDLETSAPEQTLAVGRMVMQGGPSALSYRNLKKVFGGDKNIADFYDELIDRGLGDWKNPNEHRSGFLLSREGDILFRNYYRKNFSPTPEGE